MHALELLALVREVAVVDRLLQHAMQLRARQWLSLEFDTGPIRETTGGHHFSQPVQWILTGGVQFKRLPYQRTTFRIEDNDLSGMIVQIPDRSDHGPDPVLDLLFLPPADVLAQVVDVILRHAKEHRKHELALRIILEEAGWEFQILDRPEIQKVDQPSAIGHVASQSVGMPGDDAGRFTAFDPGEHGIEHGSPRSLCALLFEQYVDHLQLVLRGQIAGLGKLVFDAANLAFFIVGGFTSVDEILQMIHAMMISRICCMTQDTIGYLATENVIEPRSFVQTPYAVK